MATPVGILMALVVMVSGVVFISLVLYSWEPTKLLQRKMGSSCTQIEPTLKPVMSVNEKKAYKFIVERPDNGNKTYFEWGSGGSTPIATPWFGRSFVVEHVPSWCAKVQNDPRVQCATREGRVTFLCDFPDLPLGNFGYPKKEEDIPKFAMYPGYMDKVADEYGIDRFDVVMIDGRFRVACALTAIKYVDRDSIVMIHDFSNRPYYHKVLNFYEPHPMKMPESPEQLAVLRIKEGVNPIEVAKTLEEYKYVAK